jgi:acyl-CoA thioester hydrolase
MTQPRKPGGKSRAKTPRVRAAATPEPAPAPTVTESQTPRTLARIPMPVRWGDLDAFNHVNNATFLVYAQEARLAWLADVDGTWFDETMMPVVAAAQINFRRQLAWPAQIVVELGVKRIGNASLTITHCIVAAENAGQIYADGEVVMVWVDPGSGRSVPLPEAIRSACQSPEESGATTSK